MGNIRYNELDLYPNGSQLVTTAVKEGRDIPAAGKEALVHVYNAFSFARKCSVHA